MTLRRNVLIALVAFVVLLCIIIAIRGCHRIRSTPVTWYVRPDGGTRYSTYKPDGQCNGQADAPYPGSGTNQPCAFKDIRNLWADGSYTASASGFPKYGWVGQGGDTYIIDCPADCRIGYSGPNSNDYYGAIAGAPYSSGAPVPPSGTADAHTRILGKNWQNCADDAAKAHINGGYGVSGIFNLKGASYIDFACFTITDHSSCGKAGQTSKCATGYPMSDYADNGIVTSRDTTNVSITDVRIHGLTNAGMIGPTGDGVKIERVVLVGNASSGWNMDAGNGTTGTGSLTFDHFEVLWNGCAEQYPIIDALPYADCTDQNSSGYGDGWGTASAHSDPPWHITMSHSVAAYNTQDGLDGLHLGGGSSLTLTDSLMYGNMGQQLKVGTQSTARNNLIVGNCNALRQTIPGTPAGYNSRLSNYCRAGDSAVAIAVSDTAGTIFQHNTMYCANATCVEVSCAVATCTAASTITYQNNVFVGHRNSVENGYPASPPPTNDYSNPIYTASNLSGLFTNKGSLFTNNAAYHWKSNWTCPKSSWGETSAVCADPQLADQAWHLYGYGDMHPQPGSPLPGKGAPVAEVTTDYDGKPRANPPAIGAYEGGSQPPPQPAAAQCTLKLDSAGSVIEDLHCVNLPVVPARH